MEKEKDDEGFTQVNNRQKLGRRSNNQMQNKQTMEWKRNNMNRFETLNQGDEDLGNTMEDKQD